MSAESSGHFVSKMAGVGQQCEMGGGNHTDLAGLLAQSEAESDISKRRSKNDPILGNDVSQYFDSKKSPESAKFLSDLGISKPDHTNLVGHKSNNLSPDFYPPSRQVDQNGNVTKACMAYALTSDMEYTGKTPKLSADLAYGLMRATYALKYPQRTSNEDPIEAAEKKTPGNLTSNVKNLPDNLQKSMEDKLGVRAGENITDYKSSWDHGSGATVGLGVLKNTAISPQSSLPRGEFFPKSLSNLKDRKFKIDDAATLNVRDDNNGTPKVNLGLVKLLVDTKHPPDVLISSEARVEQGEWIKPKNSAGIKHIVNVVGYGEGIDPFDLRKKPYLIIRDSLGSKEIHYKVDAATFLHETKGLIKIKSVNTT